ncbi:hypothetical protein [Tomitella gaofuii]|uniref:hypothetical protein n=1 Tax=Tomitella gaofuii TaxID=2760083 RepID=UPI0015FCA157|nr:hypothetical protein [Tomitella gaofuii]
MNTAKLMLDEIGGFAGPARCYEMFPPLAGQRFVTVFTSEAFKNRETVVVPSYGPDRGGAAKSMQRLPGSVSGFAQHEYALFVAGYALEEG